MSVDETSRGSSELEWVKSSYSSEEGGECVEVASLRGAVHIRDSKNVTGPVLTVGPGAWDAFLGMVPPAGL
ncbi:DUF397 domain-containing protein [Streptomyces tanashiensis]|uniref:DUF397 domain-containing protein n=1 Tax=Streptomyces tanashiensis TaxID=67367 RepID=UPI00343377EC